MTVDTEKNNTKYFQAVCIVIIILSAFWYCYGNGLEGEAAEQISQIEEPIYIDAEKKYETARIYEDAVDSSVRAAIVAAVVLQTNYEIEIKKEKEIEQREYADAGF